MPQRIPTIADVHEAECSIRPHVSPAPLIRSIALERRLQLPESQRVWLKDYGWTPAGSFKLMGALNWMAHHSEEIGARPVAAHSSGNFASGIAYAGLRFGKRVIVVMPDTAPRIKFERTRSFGAEVRTYNIARDHETGERDRLTHEISVELGAILASPYDDPHVIAGNGVGGLEIVRELRREERDLGLFLAPISGGGLMAGLALAIHDGFPQTRIVGLEPVAADDYRQSLAAGKRVRVDHPTSICDGLLSYDVGEHNWPILQQLVPESDVLTDDEIRRAMRWMYDQHGLRIEPSGAITIASLLESKVALPDRGDIALTISGRNVDDEAFREWINL